MKERILELDRKIKTGGLTEGDLVTLKRIGFVGIIVPAVTATLIVKGVLDRIRKTS